MITVGITGGIGCGKSLVLSYLREQKGIPCYETDQMAKDLIEPNGACYQKIISLLGKTILTENDRIDYRKMSKFLFGNHSLREEVNSIIHPAVFRKMEALKQEAKEDLIPIIVFESALFLQRDYRSYCDELWYVYADEAVRRERLKASRGYSDQKIDSVFAAQNSDTEYRMACKEIIENNNDKEVAFAQLDEILVKIGER